MEINNEFGKKINDALLEALGDTPEFHNIIDIIQIEILEIYIEWKKINLSS